MSEDLEKWNRLTRVLMWTTAITAGLILFCVFAPLFWKAQQMRLQNSQLKEQIEQVRILNDKLAIQIAALQKDPRAVEKEARESLGLAKPRETIYRFQDSKDAPPQH